MRKVHPLSFSPIFRVAWVLLVLGITHVSSYRVTVLHTTDVHGWINAHTHKPAMNADFGDLYDLTTHMKAAATPSSPVFLFDTGDLVQGTGLSDATPIPGQFIFEVAKRIPYDALTCGNHELYDAPVIQNCADNFVPYWNGSYLSANIRLTTTGPLGSRYLVRPLGGELGGNMVVFGFLYNDNTTASNVVVDSVESTVQTAWFLEALNVTDIRLVVVLGHLAWNAPEVAILKKAIRDQLPVTPLVFLTGHSHIERSVKPTNMTADPTVILESGCYFNEVGLLQFNLSVAPTGVPVMSNLATRFVSANRTQFQTLSGASPQDYPTAEGAAIRATILAKAAELHLSEVVGCSDRLYDSQASFSSNSSAYRLMVDTIMPALIAIANQNQGDAFPALANGQPFFIVNSASIRANIYPGAIVNDDLLAVDPFNNSMAMIPHVTGSDLLGVTKIIRKRVSESEKDYSWAQGPLTTELLAQIQSREAAEAAANGLEAAGGQAFYYSSLHIQNDSSTLYNIACTDYDTKKILGMLRQVRPDNTYATKPLPHYSRTILRDYVQTQFLCAQPIPSPVPTPVPSGPPGRPDLLVPIVLSSISLAAVVTVVIVVLVWRRRQRHQRYAKIVHAPPETSGQATDQLLYPPQDAGTVEYHPHQSQPYQSGAV
ncbi:putative 5' nucleotidase family protein [Paratrimastix pyriformis]|uniref:5' nucleotidase family protein n=1 Tax=Paratrimastix pyriformis TaxID=342808 RepID=A0ABQ8U7V1_9EUKA|nr:putative 5' nucleotidase family protein [Paratrimastix pyriformis]|eukprot:GAFH01000976.1.p1 GENE.GAFH01000976.1~~GAFH01000976.1.p1  ORF type:complete len:657 (+),score=143.32 GAFH01000976.1:23-1993(+)